MARTAAGSCPPMERRGAPPQRPNAVVAVKARPLERPPPRRPDAVLAAPLLLPAVCLPVQIFFLLLLRLLLLLALGCSRDWGRSRGDYPARRNEPHLHRLPAAVEGAAEKLRRRLPAAVKGDAEQWQPVVGQMRG